MSLLQIGIFAAASLLIRGVSGLKTQLAQPLRKWLLLIISLLAIYWLQPANSVRYLDFWLPTIIIVIVVLHWAFLMPPALRRNKPNLLTVSVIFGLILLVGATRMVSFRGILTATRPPQFWQTLLVITFSMLGYALIAWRAKSTLTQKFIGLLLLSIGLLVLMKTPLLVEKTSFLLRTWLKQSPEMASATDIRWFGLSYILFRLLATVFDKRNRQLQEIDLADYFTYVFFFPTLTAGPIDRLHRFRNDLPSPQTALDSDLLTAGKRIALGMFKKFVLADTLALIALNQSNVFQIQQQGWMWLALYAYTFQILLDFSGYTDIVLGIGTLIGIDLPENFNFPYLAKNISAFWRRWHITLSNWFRDYVFIPLEWRVRKHPQKRWLRDLHMLIVFLLTGLWHGVTVNFIIWGLWHGFGLVGQSHWDEWLTPKIKSAMQHKPVQLLTTFLRWGLTFHYVALGWVWFALPHTEQAWHVFQILIGA